MRRSNSDQARAALALTGRPLSTRSLVEAHAAARRRLREARERVRLADALDRFNTAVDGNGGFILLRALAQEVEAAAQRLARATEAITRIARDEMEGI